MQSTRRAKRTLPSHTSNSHVSHRKFARSPKFKLRRSLSASIRFRVTSVCGNLAPSISSALCFQALTNPFSRNSLLCTSIQNHGGFYPTTTLSAVPPPRGGSQLLCSLRVAASWFLFALFCRVPSFVFNRLQPLPAKSGGGGTSTRPARLPRPHLTTRRMQRTICAQSTAASSGAQKPDEA